MTNRKHFKRGGKPTFECITCERTTRDTGQGVDHLCEDCFEIAGLDNQVNDSGEAVDAAVLKECEARLKRIAKLGGNVERVKASNSYIWAAPKPTDDLDIPPFLRRQKNGATPKVSAPKKKATTSPVAKPQAKEPTLLEQIEDAEFRTYVAGEIKAGRIQGKWLADGSTLQLLRSQYDGRQARREEGLARLAEYKASQPKSPPKPKTVHAEDALFIASFDEANPRKPGSANHAKYEKFKAYLATNRSATVGEIVAKTGYYRNDLMWDVKQGRIQLTETLPAKAIVARNIKAIEAEADAKVAKAKRAKKK